MNNDLLKAARNLIDQLDLVHTSSKYEAVWSLYHVHCGEYNGPKYGDQLLELRRIVVEEERKIFHHPV